MPGRQITDQQYKYYMDLRGTGMTQVKAGLKAGISERTGRRLEKQGRSPSQKDPRHWRTRKDPFEDVFDSEVVPLLEQSYQVTARTILDHLQESHPGAYPDRLLRTLQRRVRSWRGVYGKEKEIIFYQEHPPGQRGLSDYTKLKGVQITIRGVPFEHLLYHFRLAFCGWRHVSVVEGGESFDSLSRGLQDALWRLGGSPLDHRTDSLSAAFKNLNQAAKEDFTAKYDHLMEHYHMTGTRNNRGQSHENGSIECPHRHLKDRLVQELELRGSTDFDSVQEYEKFLQKIVGVLNGRQTQLIKEEKKHLQPLPSKRTIDFEELTIRVTRASTLQVKGVVYTVPSRLIGHKLRLRLYHDRLSCYLGKQFLFDRPRVYGKPSQKTYVVDYRHVIGSLVKKPNAFAHSLMRDALLPTDVYQQIWTLLQKMCSQPRSCRLIVGLLDLAAQSGEEKAIGDTVLEALHQGHLPCLENLSNRYGKAQSKTGEEDPEKLFSQGSWESPSLEIYDALLNPHQEVAHV